MSLAKRLKTRVQQGRRFLEEEVWHHREEQDLLTRFVLPIARVLLISLEGIGRNRIVSQAAALSFYSLIGLGPVLAISVMISGFIFRDTDTTMITRGIEQALEFIAPPAAEFERIENVAEDSSPQDTGLVAGTVASPTRVNPQVVAVIEQIISSSRSGAVGVAGIGVLFMICIQLLTSIENSFNSIWGIRRGRPFNQRLILYWSLITLGATVAFTAMTVRIASAIEEGVEKIPVIGVLLVNFGLQLAPLFAFVAVALVLALFFRFIPNTRVNWKPALAGGLFVSLLLYLNNYLSFLYIQRVIVNQSLYGSIGIIPILMLGIFIFWMFILLGGQLTYSIQNVSLLTSQQAWSNVSSHTREALSLRALFLIARKFHRCEPGPTPEDLAGHLRSPSQILNRCLEQLEDMGLISSVESQDDDDDPVLRYQPGRPLNRIYLDEFREEFSRYGNNQAAERIAREDPLVHYYFSSIQPQSDVSLRPTLESLLEQAPASKRNQQPPV